MHEAICSRATASVWLGGGRPEVLLLGSSKRLGLVELHPRLLAHERALLPGLLSSPEVQGSHHGVARCPTLGLLRLSHLSLVGKRGVALTGRWNSCRLGLSGQKSCLLRWLSGSSSCSCRWPLLPFQACISWGLSLLHGTCFRCCVSDARTRVGHQRSSPFSTASSGGAKSMLI